MTKESVAFGGANEQYVIVSITARGHPEYMNCTARDYTSLIATTSDGYGYPDYLAVNVVYLLEHLCTISDIYYRIQSLRQLRSREWVKI